MLEAASVLAGGAVISLILAGAVWAYSLGRSQLRFVEGSATSTDIQQLAALLLLATFGISAVAALLAIAG